MIALCYAFMMQQRNNLAVEKYDDPSIQAIYKIFMQEFPVDKDNKIDLTLQMQSFCDVMTSQFTKILKCDQGHSKASREQSRQYAKDEI